MELKKIKKWETSGRDDIYRGVVFALAIRCELVVFRVSFPRMAILQFTKLIMVIFLAGSQEYWRSRAPPLFPWLEPGLV